MPSTVYVSTIEPNAGKSLVSLGLVDLLLRRSPKIGYFRPVVADAGDAHLHLLLDHFKLPQTPAETYAFESAAANDLLGAGELDQLLDGIIRGFKALADRCDFVLVEGTDFAGESASFEFDVNAAIARNLGCPVLLVGSGHDRSPEEATRQLRVAMDNFLAEETEVIGAVLNRVPEGREDDYLRELRRRLGGTGKKKEMAVIPYDHTLASPTVREIAAGLGAEVLYPGDPEAFERPVRRFSLAAMQLPGLLDFVTDDCAVVTPADRGDIIVGSLLAHRSSNYPGLSCVVVTGPYPLDRNIQRLLEGFTGGVPVLKVTTNSYQTALALNDVRARLSTNNPEKIEAALRLFHGRIDTTHLERKIADFRARGISPKMFLYALRERALAEKRHVVLPEGTDERILRAAGELQRDGLVDLTLLGDRAEIAAIVARLGIRLDLDGLRGIVDPQHAPQRQRYAHALYEARRHKGMTELVAEDVITDVSYFGTMMVHLGDADGMVSGAAHTTQHTIRPALQFVKTRPGVSLVSSVFFMCLPDRVVVYGDCAINPDPTAEELAQIAATSADTARAFGIEPRVAMLSYSSGASGKGSDVEKVRAATALAQALRPDTPLDGPIQYDAAVDAAVGQKKLPGSPVAGRASVLIFPDLNTGNNTYKAVQRETGAIAVGPVLQGLNKPVNDLSRGCTVEDVINTVLITAIQAGRED